MNLYSNNDSKDVSYRNMGQIQKVVADSGAIIDTSLWPIIDRAEDGDYQAMRELWNIFVFGDQKIKPNYQLAERYWFALHDQAKLSCRTEIIAQTKADYAFMQRAFGKPTEVVRKELLDAMKYMVCEAEPEEWDTDRLYRLIKTIGEVVEWEDE